MGVSATVAASDFLDTTKSFVMMSADALSLARKKGDAGTAKRVARERAQLKREERNARHLISHLHAYWSFNDARDE